MAGIHMGHMLNTVKAKAQPVQMFGSNIDSHLRKKTKQLVLLQTYKKVARVCIFSRQQTLLHFSYLLIE